MMANFLILLKNVFNATSSENDYMVIDNDIFYFNEMKNGSLSKRRKLKEYLEYSEDDRKWCFKDHTINSIVVYAFLIPTRKNFKTDIRNILFETPDSFKNYLIATSFQNDKNMMFRNDNMLYLPDQNSEKKTTKAIIRRIDGSDEVFINIRFFQKEQLENIKHLNLGHNSWINFVIYVGRRNLNEITFDEFVDNCIFVGVLGCHFPPDTQKPNNQDKSGDQRISTTKNSSSEKGSGDQGTPTIQNLNGQKKNSNDKGSGDQGTSTIQKTNDGKSSGVQGTSTTKNSSSGESSSIANTNVDESSIWKNKKTYYVLIPVVIFMCAILFIAIYYLRLSKEEVEQKDVGGMEQKLGAGV